MDQHEHSEKKVLHILWTDIQNENYSSEGD